MMMYYCSGFTDIVKICDTDRQEKISKLTVNSKFSVITRKSLSFLWSFHLFSSLLSQLLVFDFIALLNLFSGPEEDRILESAYLDFWKNHAFKSEHARLLHHSINDLINYNRNRN